MRFLVADDEYLVRTTIISMLIELGINKTHIVEATNGVELITKAKEERFDIILVDIRMPLLNGLEAIAELKAILTQTTFVIISGHSEFEYAQKAIKLGVKDYLLKPVEPQELEQMIQRIQLEVNENQTQKNLEIESEINSLYAGLLENEEIVYETKKYQSIHIQMDTFHTLDKQDIVKKIHRDLSQRIQGLINMDQQIFYINGTKMDMSIAIINNGDDIASDQLLNTIRRINLQVTNEEMDIHVFMSDRVDSSEQFIRQIRQIENLVDIRFLIHDRRVIFLEFVKALFEKASKEQLKVTKVISQLYKHCYERDYYRFLSLIEELVTLEEDITQYLTVNKSNTKAELVKELKEIAEKHLKQTNLVKTDMLTTIKDYIHSNYMKNIGVNQIAEMLEITPNYLSSLFKKKEGITLLRYLTNVRMKMAFKILDETDLKVNEVANQVGFYSARHFSKLYKQKYGYYPSEQKKG